MTRTHLTAGRPSAVTGARCGPPAHRPTWIEVDAATIRSNVAALKQVAGTPLLLAAVKANGYGHGLVTAARAAVAGGADWLGVAMIEEAEALRAADIVAPVLMLNEPPAAAIPGLLRACVTPVVYTPAFVDALAAHARATDGGPFAVHVKLDTGMRRVGVPEADWQPVLRRVAATPEVRVQGLMSHFAVADEVDDDFTDAQVRRFAEGLALARDLGLDPAITHLANSAGVIRGRGTTAEMVRPGIAVYGLDPGGGLAAAAGVRPALTWWTRVSLVKRLQAGEAIGYGLTWTAPHDATIATLPVGYGDGLRRRLSNVGAVVVGGRRAPIRGRVSMDQTLVEVPDGVDVAIGDEVALIGTQGGQSVTADDWAGWLDTITYEVTTAITARVPRVVVDDRPDASVAGDG